MENWMSFCTSVEETKATQWSGRGMSASYRQTRVTIQNRAAAGDTHGISEQTLRTFHKISEPQNAHLFTKDALAKALAHIDE